MAFLITTTGTAPDTGFGVGAVVLDDLGQRVFTHPTVDFDLETEFTREDIQFKDDLWTAIDNGWLTAEDEFGNSISEQGQEPHSLGNHTDVDYTVLPDGEDLPASSGSQVGDVLTYNGGAWRPTTFSYRHIQGSASAVWTVNHNLGRRISSVYIENSFGEECIADITQVDNNQLTITFSASESGNAYLL
jgi:hypothetical protein